jgi:GH24 family phage-related lysozyme (muramidase)
MAMTPDQWAAEVRRRLGINEGCRLTMYLDTMGIPTIAYGFNLQDGNPQAILKKAGVTDIAGVIAGRTPLTQAQADSTFAQMLPGYIADAKTTLGPGVFDKLNDARRFVIVDMVYNLGVAGFLGFPSARRAINSAVAATSMASAHAFYEQAADQMVDSAWYTQVGNRAKRNVAMMRNGTWVDPNGDGSS